MRARRFLIVTKPGPYFTGATVDWIRRSFLGTEYPDHHFSMPTLFCQEVWIRQAQYRGDPTRILVEAVYADEPPPPKGFPPDPFAPVTLTG